MSAWENHARRGKPDGHGNVWCQSCGGAAIAPMRGQTIFLCHGCKVSLPRELTAEEHEERARGLDAAAAHHRTCAASIKLRGS